jgi:hypothetical protein
MGPSSMLGYGLMRHLSLSVAVAVTDAGENGYSAA